ncbi:MAG: site-2 protease family protein [Patescibacteria group bacterium]
MDEAIFKLFLYIIIIFSAVIHEFSHGWMAYRLGDSTAKDAGRLTLNPLVHLDAFGTVIIPLFLMLTSGIFIGWAKPVPYNPYNLKDPKYGSLKVGIAGPAANFLVAIIIGLILRFSPGLLLWTGLPPIFLEFLTVIIYVNIFLGLFNLIPVPPLDGSKVLNDLFPQIWHSVMNLGFAGIFVALFAAMFLLPPIAQFIFWLITGQGIGF